MKSQEQPNKTFSRSGEGASLTSNLQSNPDECWTSVQARETLAEWQRLLSLATPRKIPARTPLFFQGEQPREVFILASGMVELVHDLPDGSRSPLTLRYPGHVIQHCDPNPAATYPVSALTLVPSEIHRLDISRMREFERRNPAVSAFQLQILKQDLHHLAIAHLRSKILSPAERLEQILWEIATVLDGIQSNHRARLALPLTEEETAALCGLSYSHFRLIRRQLIKSGRLTRIDRRLWSLSRSSRNLKCEDGFSSLGRSE